MLALFPVGAVVGLAAFGDGGPGALDVGFVGVAETAGLVEGNEGFALGLFDAVGEGPAQEGGHLGTGLGRADGEVVLDDGDEVDVEGA